jgi:hypothetical protein
MATSSIALSSHGGRCRLEALNTKSVCFFPKVSVALIPNRKDLADEESENIWYSSEDNMCMRQDLRKDIETMELRSESCLDTEICCSLGLKTAEEMEHDEVLRRFAIRTVLFEQHVQCDEQEHDPELMADLYSDSTCYHKRCAKERAVKLASEMQQPNSLQSESLMTTLSISRTNYSRTLPPHRKSPLRKISTSRFWKKPCTEFALCA